MDWDDTQRKPAKQIIVGEPLSDLSVDELDQRIVNLRAEIIRVEGELKSKRSQNAAADKLFNG